MTATLNASTSNGVILTSDTSGNLALQSNGTTVLTVTSTGLSASSSIITSGTAVASTSGTSIDFTSLPSWIKRITVMFNGVSLSGTANPLIQLGTGGTPTTSGYVATTSYVTTPNSSGTAGGFNATNGFVIQGANAAYTLYGSMVFTNVSGNIWVSQGCFANIPSTALAITAAGGVTLSGVLNMVRITTSNGTDTFDSGSINILYE